MYSSVSSSEPLSRLAVGRLEFIASLQQSPLIVPRHSSERASDFARQCQTGTAHTRLLGTVCFHMATPCCVAHHRRSRSIGLAFSSGGFPWPPSLLNPPPFSIFKQRTMAR